MLLAILWERNIKWMWTLFFGEMADCWAVFIPNHVTHNVHQQSTETGQFFWAFPFFPTLCRSSFSWSREFHPSVENVSKISVSYSNVASFELCPSLPLSLQQHLWKAQACVKTSLCFLMFREHFVMLWVSSVVPVSCVLPCFLFHNDVAFVF